MDVVHHGVGWWCGGLVITMMVLVIFGLKWEKKWRPELIKTIGTTLCVQVGIGWEYDEGVFSCSGGGDVVGLWCWEDVIVGSGQRAGVWWLIYTGQMFYNKIMLRSNECNRWLVSSDPKKGVDMGEVWVYLTGFWKYKKTCRIDLGRVCARICETWDWVDDEQGWYYKPRDATANQTRVKKC